MSRADYIMPKQLQQEEAITAVIKWMAEGDYTPDDIFHQSKSIPKFDYLPIYKFTANYQANATVFAVTMRSRHVTKYMNGKPYQDTEWYTVPLTFYNQTAGEFGTTVYTGSIDKDSIRKFVEATDWNASDMYVLDNNGAPYDHMFSRDKETEWKDIAYKRMHKEAIAKAEREAMGVHKIINTNLDYTDIKVEAYGLLLPFFLFAYVYEGKDYHVIVDANNPERLDGVRPVNNKRQLAIGGLRTIIYGATIYGIYRLSQSAYIDSHENLFWWSVFVPALIVILLVEIPIYFKKSKWRKHRENILQGLLNHLSGTQRLEDQNEEDQNEDDLNFGT
jgi:hypothetical protein